MGVTEKQLKRYSARVRRQRRLRRLTLAALALLAVFLLAKADGTAKEETKSEA